MASSGSSVPIAKRDLISVKRGLIGIWRLQAPRYLKGHSSVKSGLNSVKRGLNSVKRDLIGVKRDLISVKRDLISVKRDLISVKRDLISVYKVTLQSHICSGFI